METNIIWIVVMAVLFIFVWLNNKRNMKNKRERRNNRFEDRYASKKNKNLES
ncbi:hypothetical protein JoomaDRAFT_2464 [Galbibacter orientalis DSM 19592]|uniref:Uncharacterized protein n=1 Tax=Galbibacter orientalis DSM 19592 TaxID=926559 RepID=I3C750_9FLAO|nr:hypothetical protein JoomaDRAFT_2464 [Galbibacter orientalis DSM 19592]